MKHPSTGQALSKLDRNFAAAAVLPGKFVWHDIRRLGIEGKGWTRTGHFYDRLPARAEGLVTPPVWELSHHSAGMLVRFATDAGEIAARWLLRHNPPLGPHVSATGQAGLDLYVHHAGRWRWAGVGLAATMPACQTMLLSTATPAMRKYTLYLPLYSGIESVHIGLPRGCKLTPLPRRGNLRPICFYGTSVTQGGCASRPGVAYPAILGRWFDRPVINLGFSGCARAELAMAKLLAELDPCVYFIDCMANVNPPEWVAQRMGPFLRTLRQARPKTPIVVVETLPFQQPAFVRKQYLSRTTKNASLRKVYRGLLAEGITGLTYVRSRNLYGRDGEATIDGAHPTDLGFMRIARTFARILRPLV